MTDYWVDPLNGNTANSGTTYTAALSSFVDIFNGNLSGGITRGDRVFLMATTGDNADVSITVPGDDGAYAASQGIEGTTMGWRQFRGVNPDTLQEDGTKYILGTRNNQYASMIGKMERLCFYNIEFVGHLHVYTSGNGGVIFRYCIFSDGHPLIPNYTGPIRSAYMGNAAHSFSECLFINRGYNSNHTQAIRSGGSVYSSQQDYTNCEFRGFEDHAIYLDNNSLLYNCRFIDNGVGHYQTPNMNRDSKSHTTNCFFENNDIDIIWNNIRNTTREMPMVRSHLGNVHNNCGGYNIQWGEVSYPISSMTSWRSQRNLGFWNIDGNIYQNSTSGYSDKSFAGTTFEQLGWCIQDKGWTYGVFGTTFDPGSSGESRIMVGTADAQTFAINNGRIGVFIDNLTEAIVTGNTTPEFGDMF
jgi:hypothetical protein